MSEKKLASKQEKVEYEKVPLNIPTKLMNYVRKMKDDPVDWLEYLIVDSTRAELEAMTGAEFVEEFQLGPVFKEVLGENRFGKAIG